MKDLIHKNEGVFKKSGLDCFALLNINSNMLFLFDSDVEILWDLLDKISLNELYEKLLDVGYKLDKEDLLSFVENLAKCGLVSAFNTKVDENFSRENNQLNEYINECISLSVPSILHLELTNTCNLKCIHCYHDETHKFLGVEDVKKLFSDLKNSSFVRVILTGGEFFLHSDWKEIIVQARENGLLVSILSNITTLQHEDLNFLRDINLFSIRTSLYGASSKTHDKVTEVAGSFKKTFNNIKVMKKLGIPISASCTIMKHNLNEIRELNNIMQELDVDISFDFRIIPSRNNTKPTTTLMIEKEDFELLYKEGLVKKPNRINCNLGGYRISIDSFGKVYLCDMLRISVGNIKTDNLLSILKTEKANFLKEKSKLYDPEFCNVCKHSDYCTRCPGFSWSEGNINNVHCQVQCLYCNIAYS